MPRRTHPDREGTGGAQAGGGGAEEEGLQEEAGKAKDDGQGLKRHYSMTVAFFRTRNSKRCCVAQ